jgi:glutathione S-transferase
MAAMLSIPKIPFNGRVLSSGWTGQTTRHPYPSEEQGRHQITKEVGQLDEHLALTGPYITGEAFTVGDIPIGLVVHRWFCLNFNKPSYSSVARYYEQLSTRPAYRRHVRNGLP